MSFTENLTAARRRCNLTPQEVATHLGVQKEQVYRWEKGKQEMGVYKLIELCKLYKISADELLGIKVVPPMSREHMDEGLLEELKRLPITDLGTGMEVCQNCGRFLMGPEEAPFLVCDRCGRKVPEPKKAGYTAPKGENDHSGADSVVQNDESFVSICVNRLKRVIFRQ